MGTTKLKIYNGALGYLGVERLHDTDGLTEDVPARYELDREYDGALAYMLSLGLWDFAIREVELTADPNITSAFGFAYTFAHPDDFVRMAGISPDGNFYPADEPNWKGGGGYWRSNNDTIYLKYVSSHVNWGLNLGAYPQHYCEALYAWLAYKTTLPITKDRGDRNDVLAQHRDHLKNSRRLDAVDEPIKRQSAGRLTQGRRGYRQALVSRRF